MAMLLMSWNANGLLCKQSELKQHVANNAYDVICIQETFLKPDKKFSVPAYDVIRTNRDTVRGGLVMLLKAGTKYMQLPSPQGIESQVVEVSTANGKLTIVNVYVPPTIDIDVGLYQALFTRPNTIIVGDLNAKNKLWNSATENGRGRAIETLVTQHNYVVLNTGQPTFQNSRGHTSHIDLALVSHSLGAKCTWTTMNNTMGSDHMPMITEVGESLYVEVDTVLKWRVNIGHWKTRKTSADHTQITIFAFFAVHIG